MKRAVWLFALSLSLALGAPAAIAAAPPDPYPLVATYDAFAKRAFSLDTVRLVEQGFAERRGEILKRGGKQLARTDEGYGPVYRARFLLKDGHVTLYSGIMDGWRSEWHFPPCALKTALDLARTHHAASSNSALKVDFDHPASRDASQVSYTSPSDGCEVTYTLQLDRTGRCVGIILSGGC